VNLVVGIAPTDSKKNKMEKIKKILKITSIGLFIALFPLVSAIIAKLKFGKKKTI